MTNFIDSACIPIHVKAKRSIIPVYHWTCPYQHCGHKNKSFKEQLQTKTHCIKCGSPVSVHHNTIKK